MIEKLKFKYMGRMVRKGGEKRNRLAIEWLPCDLKQKRGRPNIKYKDKITRAVGPNWTSIAQNGKWWKMVTETNALQ